MLGVPWIAGIENVVAAGEFFLQQWEIHGLQMPMVVFILLATKELTNEVNHKKMGTQSNQVAQLPYQDWNKKSTGGTKSWWR